MNDQSARDWTRHEYTLSRYCSMRAPGCVSPCSRPSIVFNISSAQRGGDAGVILVLSTATSDRAKGYRRRRAHRLTPGLPPAALGKIGALGLRGLPFPIRDATPSGPFLPGARGSRVPLLPPPPAAADAGPPSGSHGHTRVLPIGPQPTLRLVQMLPTLLPQCLHCRRSGSPQKTQN